MSIRKLARRGILLAMLAMVLPGQLLAQEVKENCNQESWDYFKASMKMVGGLSLFAASVATPWSILTVGVALEVTGDWAEELNDYMECRIEVENIDPSLHP